MKQYIEHDLFMLSSKELAEERPTYYKDILSLNDSKHNKRLEWFRSIHDTNIPNPQHLYITSNKLVENGEWYISNSGGIHQWKMEGMHDGKSTWCNVIIATTDKFLKTSLNTHSELHAKSIYFLPQIPQQFIEYYITEYNKGNIITKVLVEYEITPMGKVIIEYGAEEKNVTSLTLNPDNAINIKPIEVKMYSKEEVESILFQYASEVWGVDTGKSDIDDFNEWIEENV